MNIKKLASLLFQRSVIVALLIFLQAAMLLLYMLGVCGALHSGGADYRQPPDRPGV